MSFCERIFPCCCRKTPARRATNEKDDKAAVREKVKSIKTRPNVDTTKFDSE